MTIKSRILEGDCYKTQDEKWKEKKKYDDGLMKHIKEWRVMMDKLDGELEIRHEAQKRPHKAWNCLKL